jgi:pantoate--beta-alanine ligase
MQILTTLAGLRQTRAAMTGTLGLVPTHGNLHAGKLSLVARARAECDHVAVSRLPPEALASDDQERDLRLLEPLAVDLVWAPSRLTAYPPDFQTWVSVEHVAAPLEGKHRPGHFRAVATQTTRLFNAFAPSRAYYGQIDAQQLAVVCRLVRDLDFAVQIVDCPTVREPDGLALSRRNAALSAPERLAAAVLYRALSAAHQAYIAGERDGDTLRAILSSTLAAEPLAREEYVSVAQADSLDELPQVEQGALLSLAARIGKVRLLDSLSLG